MKDQADDTVRIDKWLWAARLFKTRSLAVEALDRGRVRIDGQRIKPARAARIGDHVIVERSDERIELVIRGLAAVRGPATVARTLYEETQESRQRRESQAAAHKLQPEPALARRGRPTKRDGRELRRWSTGHDDRGEDG
jgi:ribosome-associated heat shock protein Hsp15